MLSSAKYIKRLIYIKWIIYSLETNWSLPGGWVCLWAVLAADLGAAEAVARWEEVAGWGELAGVARLGATWPAVPSVHPHWPAEPCTKMRIFRSRDSPSQLVLFCLPRSGNKESSDERACQNEAMEFHDHNQLSKAELGNRNYGWNSVSCHFIGFSKRWSKFLCWNSTANGCAKP